LVRTVNDDLTPRTSHTGLYVAGAAILAIGWWGALRLAGDPAESSAERRMRARMNSRRSCVDGWWMR
jgi:hypothetical protein